MDLAAPRKLTPTMITSTLARCVPRDSLETHLPVDFLFTSGKAGRTTLRALTASIFQRKGS